MYFFFLQDAFERTQHMVERHTHDEQISKLNKEIEELQRSKTDELNILTNANCILTTRTEALKVSVIVKTSCKAC